MKLVAINQYGDKVMLDAKRPRADLCEHYDTKHAEKMYIDTVSGESKHIGYIVRGEWFQFYKLDEWSKAV